MKKLLAVVLTLAALLSCAAMAEEMVPVTFEDGFQISLPADWLQIEVTEEWAAQGIFYVACSPDGANTVQISWSALESDMTIDELQAQLVTEYPDAVAIESNGIAFVGFTVSDEICGFAALDATEPGMYVFWCTPAADEAFVETATAIVTSICNVEL